MVVECSSGTSTLVLARCCQINGHGHVYSLEHGEEYAIASTRTLKEMGLESFASVIHAPLVECKLDDTQQAWYSLQGLSAKDIDMLVIDGPPAMQDKQARYPALPMLHDRLNSGCTVFLDDANRDGERVIVERWTKQYPLLRAQMFESERGCVVLERF